MTTGTTINIYDGGSTTTTTSADDSFVYAGAIGEARKRPPEIVLPDGAAEFLAQVKTRQPSNLKHGRHIKDWFRIENAIDDSADVYIFDQITDPIMSELFGVGISAMTIVRELQGLRGKTINLHIDSPGGDIFQGMGIYNTLRNHDAPVHVTVEGIAASTASLIAMAGTTITMNPHTRMMIHLPWSGVIGDEYDMAKESEILHKIGEDIAGIYSDRADSRINWHAKMVEESWLSAEEAVKLGLADRLDNAAPTASNKFDLSRFRNPPSALADGAVTANHIPTVRDAEQALRDAGFSARAAKAILAEGWADDGDERDAPPSDGSVLGEEGSGVDISTAIDTGTVADYPIDLAKARIALAEMAFAS